MADMALPSDNRVYAHERLVIHRVWNGEEFLHISLGTAKPRGRTPYRHPLRRPTPL